MNIFILLAIFFPGAFLLGAVLSIVFLKPALILVGSLALYVLAFAAFFGLLYFLPTNLLGVIGIVTFPILIILARKIDKIDKLNKENK